MARARTRKRRTRARPEERTTAHELILSLIGRAKRSTDEGNGPGRCPSEGRAVFIYFFVGCGQDLQVNCIQGEQRGRGMQGRKREVNPASDRPARRGRR